MCWYLFVFDNISEPQIHVLQITINEEAGRKLIWLLRSSLNALSCCIELLPYFSTNVAVMRTTDVLGVSGLSKEEDIFAKNATDANATTATTKTATIMTLKLIEEILHYLSRLINFAPEECVGCLRQLLKYLFGRNYANGRHYPEFVSVYMKARRKQKTGRDMEEPNEKEQDSLTSHPVVRTTPSSSTDSTTITGRTTMINSKSCATASVSGVVNTSCTDYHQQYLHRSHYCHHLNCIQECRLLAELWSAIAEFHTSKRKQGPHSELSKHIKLFEPLVIHCLTVTFMPDFNTST